MRVFVDASAVIAVLDQDDERHEAVGTVWQALMAGDEQLWVTNYVLLEASVVIQRRLGLGAHRDFWENMVPVLRARWIDETAHISGVAAVLSSGRRGLSLVDCISFQAMRDLGIRTAFTLDPHFAEQGFHCVPELDAE